MLNRFPKNHVLGILSGIIWELFECLIIHNWLIGKLEVPTQKHSKITENGANNSNAIPGRIGFLEELSDIFVRLFPDLWKLGQAYFGGELFVRVDPSKREEFKVFYFDTFHSNHLFRNILWYIGNFNKNYVIYGILVEQ